MQPIVTFKTEFLFLAEPKSRIFGLSGGIFKNADGNTCRRSSTYFGDPTPLRHARARAAEEAAHKVFVEEISDGLVACERSEADTVSYGFQNLDGQMVIDPQYHNVGQFVEGLCPVSLRPTSYRTPDGSLHYEEHWGYIAPSGQTAIPYVFSRAFDFNRFGLAVAEDRAGRFLIDRLGHRIPGTEDYTVTGQLSYRDRFVEIMPVGASPQDPNSKFLFDTRDRRIIGADGYHDSMEWDENTILVTKIDPENPAIRRKWFIDAAGDYLPPWKIAQNEIQTAAPDEEGNIPITSVRFLPADATATSFFESPDGAHYIRVVKHGLQTPEGEVAIPCAYDRVDPLGFGFYAAYHPDAEHVTVFG